MQNLLKNKEIKNRNKMQMPILIIIILCLEQIQKKLSYLIINHEK